MAQRDLAQKHGASIFQVPSTQAGDWDRALRSERMAAAAGDDFVLHVRGAGFPATGSIRGSGPAISWNAWFEEGSEANPKDVETLQVNGVYRFNLDLARYAYTTALSAGVDRRVLELLSGQGERRLLLQPVLLGPQLVAAPGSALRPRALAVQLARASATPQDAALLQSFDNGKLTARALSQQLNLGALVSWEVKAEAAGCAGIAVIVWDQARVTPLDHIVLQVPVKSGGAGPQSCASGETAQAMNAGLRTLLAGPAPAANARVPDAALHVFEHREGGAIHSRAVLIHRQRLLDAQAEPPSASQPADAGVYSWRLGSALSSYVSDDGQMSELIKGAHKAVAQPGSSFPFEDVATELSLKSSAGHRRRTRTRRRRRSRPCSMPSRRRPNRCHRAGGERERQRRCSFRSACWPRRRRSPPWRNVSPWSSRCRARGRRRRAASTPGVPCGRASCKASAATRATCCGKPRRRRLHRVSA